MSLMKWLGGEHGPWIPTARISAFRDLCIFTCTCMYTIHFLLVCIVNFLQVVVFPIACLHLIEIPAIYMYICITITNGICCLFTYMYYVPSVGGSLNSKLTPAHMPRTCKKADGQVKLFYFSPVNMHLAGCYQARRLPQTQLTFTTRKECREPACTLDTIHVLHRTMRCTIYACTSI